MKFIKTTTVTLLAGLTCLTLDSCWFNSTGKLVDVASHQARVYTSDAKVGNTIYTDGTNYYVKMDHVYNDDKPNLMLTSGTSSSQHKCYIVGSEWFKVNRSFARYLIGDSDYYDNLTSIEPVSESTAKEGTVPRTIIRSHNQVLDYHYRSPNAGWIYFGAVWEFICVDVPISVTLSVAYATIAIMAVAEANKNSSSSGYDYSANSYYDPEQALKEHQERERSYAIETAIRANNGGNL